MGHHVIGRAAVPVARLRWNDYGVAGQEHLQGLTLQLIASAPLKDVKDLAHGMRVPVGARAWGESHARGAHTRGRFGGYHLILPDDPDKAGIGRLLGRPRAGSHDPGTHWRFSLS